MSADGGAIPGVLRAVRGAAERNRVATRAVYRMDQGSVGARLSASFVVSADTVHPMRGNTGIGDTDDDYGVSAAVADAEAAGSESAEDDDVYAAGVQPDLREYAGRADAVLFFIESAGGRPAVHTQPRVQTIAGTRIDMSSTESIETTASTIDQAISQALAQLGAEQDDVTIEVLSTPRSGVLGLGARQARVRVTKRVREGAHSGVMSPPPAPPLRPTPPEMRRSEARPEVRREPSREPARPDPGESVSAARGETMSAVRAESAGPVPSGDVGE